MKIKSFLIVFFALVFSCTAFSQDNPKTATHHSTEMAQHSKHHSKHHHKHHKHHKHAKKDDSKADVKKDKK